MTTLPPDDAPEDASALRLELERLLRERDQLFLLYEALNDVERARTLDERMRILVEAIGHVGYGRVDTISDYEMPAGTVIVAWISNSAFLDSNETIVPVRAVDGSTVATLVLGDPVDPGPPTLSRVRTVELFAQQVASIVEKTRLYEESQRERERGEALAERYRSASEDERRARDAVAQSEARYRNLFETATDAIYTLDLRGSFTSVNEATCQLSGRTREELIGRGPLTLVAASDVALVKEFFKTAAAGTARRYECWFVRPDGTRRLASVTNTPIRHASRVIGILVVARDLTDEREAAIALERSETRYTRLVESASDAIFTVDVDGVLTAVNRSLERATGKERSVLLGTPVAALIDSRDQALATSTLRETYNGQRRRVELRYPDQAGGDVRYCSLTLTPLTEDDVVIGALGVVRDVTDEKRLAEQLMQQEKLAAVGQLVSGVAHELNNPLASVMAFAQLLLAAPAGALPDRSALDAISQETKRAAKIVSNLLTFARQHQPERRIADLNRVIEDTLELRRYGLRIANVEVKTELDPNLALTWADPFQLQQVILNLVTNAEQALATSDGPRTITITTAQTGDQLVIRVADNGPGVAPELVQRIFNPFFTTKPVGEGTGLGLSISDGIVREHGGRIRVESRTLEGDGEGRGATFIIELPHVVPPLPDTLAAAGVVPGASSRRRILVVDDEPALRQAVATYFRSLGHTVDVAGTGRDALARASDFEYDAIMLDLRLPDIMGDEVLAQMHRTGRAPERVVFVTGDAQSESARRVLATTGHRTMSKPFLLDELATLMLAEAG